MTFEIVELDDEAEIASLLNRNRRWTAYALSDLEPEHAAYARYIGAVRHGALEAILLLYESPAFCSVLPAGDHAGVSAILEGVRRLPQQVFLAVRLSDLEAVERRYRSQDRWIMQRMTVCSKHLKEAPPVDAQLTALSIRDLPAIEALLAPYGESIFAAPMMEHGLYMGAFLDGRLVAMAGTHTISLRYAIATIGNVYTNPAHRGRGLATATTSAVANSLGKRGIRDLVLNVREDNAPAIAAYHRLGFETYLPFWEGVALLKDR